MPIAQNIDYLSQIVDYDTGQTIYQCGLAEVELDLSFDRPSHSYSLPGVDAPYDPLGKDGNPMDVRRVPFKFRQLYDASHSIGTANPATYTSRRKDFNRAIADGRRVYGVLTDADGKTWYGQLKATSLPNRVTMDRKFWQDFDGVFEMNPPVWRTLYPSGWTFLDAGLSIDDPAFILDNNTIPELALNSTSQSLTVTNAGDAPEKYYTLSVAGPAVGFIVISIIPPNGIVRSLTYYAQLGLYQTMTMDFAAGTFRVNGVPAYNPTLIYRKKGQRDWPYLAAGTNTVLVEVAATIPIGNLSRIDVTAKGSYAGTPTVTLSGGGGAPQATAHAVMDGAGGVLAVILDTPGTYSSTPSVGFSGGTGTGAAATAQVGARLRLDSRDTRF